MPNNTVGKDTLILGDRVFTGLIDGDVVDLDVPNNLAEMKTGKNKNTIIAANSTGNNGTLSVRIVLGCDDDKFLNSQYLLYNQDPAAYPLLSGSFVKRVGDGNGNVNRIPYTLSGVFVQKIPKAKDNAEGDTEQGVAVYMLGVPNLERNIS